MVTEYYVSFETAKLLKEKGFREWCRECYGTDVRHNGVSISFDEELDLKDEGRGDEIEYVEGGIMHNISCNNSDKNIYASPTISIAMNWLLDTYKLHIVPTPYPHEDGKFYWAYKIAFLDSETLAVMVVKQKSGFDSKENACEDAIKYCLENLI